MDQKMDGWNERHRGHQTNELGTRKLYIIPMQGRSELSALPVGYEGSHWDKLKWSSECIFKRTPGASCQFAQEKGSRDTNKCCRLIPLVQHGVTFHLPEHPLQHIDFTPIEIFLLAVDSLWKFCRCKLSELTQMPSPGTVSENCQPRRVVRIIYLSVHIQLHTCSWNQ